MGIKKSSTKGFTLLEVMIVLSVMAIIIPAMFTLYFASLRAQRKVMVIRDSKRNGDNALNTIETLIKQNAVSIHIAEPPSATNQICNSTTPSSSGQQLFFKDKDGTWFSFLSSGDKIASYSASLSGNSTEYLTNTKSLISSFTLSCDYVTNISPPLVSISFTIAQNGPTGRAEEVSLMNYQTKIKLRSY